ncbi:hypothetical protein GGF37_004680, partial [Kickxella alabastrina]
MVAITNFADFNIWVRIMRNSSNAPSHSFELGSGAVYSWSFGTNDICLISLFMRHGMCALEVVETTDGVEVYGKHKVLHKRKSKMGAYE